MAGATRLRAVEFKERRLSISSTEDSKTPDRRDRRRRLYGLAALGIILCLAAWGIVSRLSAREALGATSARLATLTVRTIKPKADSTAEQLVLPGSVRAYNEAQIFARTNGYLKRWYTDIGTRVNEGQVMAEIDTPEVDQQLRQARADLSMAQANLKLAQITDERWQALLVTNSVSRQSADAAAGDASAKRAALGSAEANLARLQNIESFKHVLAPFEGVVTHRNTDLGALINAGQGVALFTVADTSRLRVYVLVPQLHAAGVTPGLAADLSFPDRPGKIYPAQVVRTASALDPGSRTLQVELLVENHNGELFPGAYVQVHFNLAGAIANLRVPANAVLFRSSSLQVAIVGADHRVILENITTGRDFGSSLEVLTGLEPGEDVIVDPPDSLVTGTPVRVTPLEPAAQPPAAAR